MRNKYHYCKDEHGANDKVVGENIKETAANRYIKFVETNNYKRAAGAAFIFSGFLYLCWLFIHLNHQVKFISYPYFLAQTFTYFVVAISVVNHWKAKYRTKRPPLPQNVPPVAIIVPTCKESMAIVRKTIKSLFYISYPGKIVIVLTNDDRRRIQRRNLITLMQKLSFYWDSRCRKKARHERKLYLIHTKPHDQAKAGNLNQAVQFLKKYFPKVDLILTQDADETVYPDILKATVGYFSDSKVAYVQTIKQAKVGKDDPFGNRSLMWYGRTAACRDAANAMFACGSGVVWRLSALESIGGFSTWNLVEDLTTSYNLLAKGWQSRYHYEALSSGLAPEDLGNFIKQRGTWAIDTLRMFFLDNPIRKKGLTFAQKLHFLETSFFYLNGIAILILIGTTSLSLIFELWPTTSNALTHAAFLIPEFMFLEGYLILRSGKIAFRRERQFWVGLSPVFAISAIKAIFYGPNKKPEYKVTKKENDYGNYLKLVWPQVFFLSLIGISLMKIIIITPLYSGFDWAAVFWGFYQASFFIQIIKVSWWKWSPDVDIKITWEWVGDFVQSKLPFGRLHPAQIRLRSVLL
jgi:cellulose synthase (UDP-forming)